MSTPRPRPPVRRALRRLPLNAAAALTVVVCLFPVYWMVTTAFKPSTDIQSYDPRLVPSAWTFEHFRKAVGADGFALFWRNSLLVTLSAVLLALLVALGAAYAVARMRWRGRRQFMLAVFVAQMAPWESLIIPIYIISRDTGMLDRLPTLTLIYFMITLPFTVVVLRGFIAGIPPELEEAALVDGANRVQAMLLIILPLAAPGVAAATIFAFTLSWNEYLYAFILMTDSTKMTLSPGMTKLVFGDIFLWGMIMSGATLMSLPVVLLYFVAQRFVVSGLTAGSVKG